MSSEYELERYLVGRHAQEDFKVPSLKIRIFSPPASEDSCEGPRLLTVFPDVGSTATKRLIALHTPVGDFYLD
jgi:hypothetical protein